MKTAISTPDDIFASADDFARRMGRPRSQVFAAAMREYLARHDEDQVTRQLDTLCAELDTRREADIALVADGLLERVEW